MHELAIAESILSVLKEHAKGKVNSVKLKIGEMSGVVPSALEFLFQIASEGTLAEGAALYIEHVPITARCDDCSKVFEIKDCCFECACCGGSNFKLITGRELFIEEIDVDERGFSNES
ncbi:MAG: hydrogenase maturation nickel metallochaperone HypA [Deltaproteobacteria bacterium]|nr:hydrogenase maturation nickel metallochaperone HypA [Deltaproteobacteria bacterium]